ncbi:MULTISPECIES: hypothetical protein [unclassified Aeromicrobium]|uniref:hypothetical protein n=1 Tax=unclassified Aeromicrobium TaxID=2633570 RepID=UPI00288B7AEB|nr:MULTISPECIES: hypothetical protein [unclassified Aeromicrobium]
MTTSTARRVPPPVTWDQASILQYATMQALADVYGWPIITMRRAVAAGHIHPVGTAPGGAHLFHVPTVLAAAEHHGWKRKTTRPPAKVEERAPE